MSKSEAEKLQDLIYELSQGVNLYPSLIKQEIKLLSSVEKIARMREHLDTVSDQLSHAKFKKDSCGACVKLLVCQRKCEKIFD